MTCMNLTRTSTSRAEREGFEPSDPVTQVNSLAVSPIRPLSHLSSGISSITITLGPVLDLSNPQPVPTVMIGPPEASRTKQRRSPHRSGSIQDRGRGRWRLRLFAGTRSRNGSGSWPSGGFTALRPRPGSFSTDGSGMTNGSGTRRRGPTRPSPSLKIDGRQTLSADTVIGPELSDIPRAGAYAAARQEAPRRSGEPLDCVQWLCRHLWLLATSLAAGSGFLHAIQ
jgi:hypothetical protein